ncbi:MAG: molybdopterin cofactor-binding domain-containing protein [Rhodothermales bacterium]
MNIDRRNFIRISTASTGGLLAGLYLPACTIPESKAANVSIAPSAFIQIDSNSTVTITIPNSEMGQGVRTSLAMVVAEELEADWTNVIVSQAPLGEQYGNQSTGGSGTIRYRWGELRKAGALVRELLIAAAAQTWGATPSQCRAEQGVITHTDGRALRYGELVNTAATLPVPEEAPLKSSDDFKIVGLATKGQDVPDIVTGRATYGLDVKIPGMRYAVIERCPVFGGTLANYDDKAALQIPGVLAIVEIPAGPTSVAEERLKGGWGTKPIATRIASGVAIIAEDTWAAMKGREALKVEWDTESVSDLSTDGIKQQMEAALSDSCPVVFNRGNIEGALKDSSSKIIADYEVPFLAHVTMEPMNCTAHVTDEGCRLWAPTQAPFLAAQAVADALDIPQSNIQINVTLMGGGFGRRIIPDFSVEAAIVSKAAGAPVKVVWTREDDIQHDFYRPMSLHHLEATLDNQGFPNAVLHRFAETDMNFSMYGQTGGVGLGYGDAPYHIPNYQVEFQPIAAQMPLGWWRAVMYPPATFARESFVDELAAVAGKDPLEYRLELLDRQNDENVGNSYSYSPGRGLAPMKAVLELAAEKADWGNPLPEGRVRGIACQATFGSYVAEIFEVSVTPENELKIHRVVAAVDCGRVINPNGAKAQIEGGIVDGISSALYGGIVLSEGRVSQGNFHDYSLLRINRAPESIEVHFIENEAEPMGLGEPALPPVAPALANAYFAATRKRIRSLPLML